MSWFTDLRSLVFLRRISRELHRSNELAEFRLSCDFPSQYAASKFSREPNAITPHRSKLVSIAHPSYAQWNSEYRKLHPEPIEED